MWMFVFEDVPSCGWAFPEKTMGKPANRPFLEVLRQLACAIGRERELE